MNPDVNDVAVVCFNSIEPISGCLRRSNLQEIRPGLGDETMAPQKLQRLAGGAAADPKSARERYRRERIAILPKAANELSADFRGNAFVGMPRRHPNASVRGRDDADPGETCRLPISADRHDAASELGMVQYEGDEDRGADCRKRQDRYPREIAAFQVAEADRDVAEVGSAVADP